MKRIIFLTVISCTVSFGGCDFSKKKPTEEQTQEALDWSCTQQKNLDQIQDYLKSEYLKIIEKNLRASTYTIDQNLLEKINKGLRFEIKTIQTVTPDATTTKKLSCESQLVVYFPKGLMQRANNAFSVQRENQEENSTATIQDYFRDNDFSLTISDDDVSSNLSYDIIKTDKEGLSLSVDNQSEILNGLAFITEQAVLYEGYVQESRDNQVQMQQQDQQQAAQYNLAQQAMNIRKKELDSNQRKLVERLNQTWDRFTDDQKEQLKQDQSDWFEKRDVDCKVLAQKSVDDLSEAEMETYQKQSDYWDQALIDQNTAMQYTKCFNQRTQERMVYLNNVFN